MKINARLMLEDLIAEGIRLGHSRAYEHIEQGIWNKINQYLNFNNNFN